MGLGNWRKSKYGRALRKAAEEAFTYEIIETESFDMEYEMNFVDESRDEWKERWIIERMEYWFEGHEEY